MPSINDVTHLNPIDVFAVAVPKSIQDIQKALLATTLPISVGGGHFSMGGHTASPDSLHLDLREFNRILAFDPQRKTIRVQAGTRWCDIQQFIDPHGLAVKIMQTYANFTVGGALSVNAHGRYMGLGPVVMSVSAITLVLANGDIVEASRTVNQELFNAAIGGYGAIGIIAEVELALAENHRIERHHTKLPTETYFSWFDAHVRGRPEAILHNADLYPPHYTKARAVTWIETDKPATTSHRLQPLRELYALEKYFLWAVTETPFGKARREHLIDPFLYLGKKVHWRNYEAGYDVAELEPAGRQHRTYVLQEYFVPVARLMDFIPKMAAILGRHKVNAVNVSIRHALADPDTVMAWARGETFALVLYYKQRTRHSAREKVAVWTRELIDAAIACGGTYYLPYQLHATPEQFMAAYPRAAELFELKRRLDPHFRLRGALWDKYYLPPAAPVLPNPQGSLFHTVYGDVRQADKFYSFLQNVFHLRPEDRFHALIKKTVGEHETDEAIYAAIQQGLPGITPFHAMLTYALPSLRVQKNEIGAQTRQLVADGISLNGYIEIGTTGRYVKALQSRLKLSGTVILVHDQAPTMSPVDIVERGQLGAIGKHVFLDDYAPLPSSLEDASVDLVSCFVGLHHMTPGKLKPFLASIARVLRPGGYFIVRDHDVKDDAMNAFVSLAHTVFNAGLGETWHTNAAELRYFASVEEWIQRIEDVGLVHTGERLLQSGDPSDNVLMTFRKIERA
ncbi:MULTISPECIES: FAD-binding protein [unclassified Duganella]|uniref:FAD-binding protein n=1 Tax=unclassified Duganella TaxID=2636909 RepID=UPI000E347CA4|nr:MULTISPECIES: FAD-binding protein [unclassified Duganella]RFP15912.1 FAD-binding protein [Duganella sp. BJB475]RFP32923.1 FAD-binding protein [Duganella sp. BJB476]